MGSEDRSELLLRITLPEALPGDLLYEKGDSRWGRRVDDVTEIPTTEDLWQAVNQAGSGYAGHLLEAGHRLGQWLLDERALAVLGDHFQERQARRVEHRGRIEVFVSPSLSNHPWELVATPAFGQLGVSSGLTLVRRRESVRAANGEPLTELTIGLFGVRLSGDNLFEELQTGREVLCLAGLIKESEWAKRFKVDVDDVSAWPRISKAFQDDGPPDIFHFAGHGLGAGKGLVFCDADGRRREVQADVVTAALTDNGARRNARLVFLNACSTSAKTTGRLQPFGPLAEQLIARGVPAVVAMSVQVGDDSALLLAQEFYSWLGRGASIDVALQAARRVLYEGADSPEWAFVSLTSAQDPVSLVAVANGKRLPVAPDVLMGFGNAPQLSRLQVLVSIREPAVIVVWGASGKGHGHLLQQIQRLAAQRGRLFDPIPVLRWFEAEDPDLLRQRLLGALCLALQVASDGEELRVIKRLGEAIGAKSLTAEAFVLSFQEPIPVAGELDERALLTLVQDLWAEILEQARRQRYRAGKTDLPIFLLVSLVFPDPERAPTEALKSRARERESKVRDLVRALASIRVEEVSLLIRSLEPLTDYSHEEIADFLVSTRLRDSEAALQWIEKNTLGEDNESILERLGALLRSGVNP